MDSDFNNSDVLSVNLDGETVVIGNSKRFRYYKARRNGLLHFIKTPSEEYTDDLLTIESLRKEFLLGYGLNHHGFVRYFSLEGKKLYEEYIEGLTLGRLMESDDKRLNQKDFIEDIARQILEALRYLHFKGILHLDLKPENIMVSDFGNQVKIIDLSCARSISIDSSAGYTAGYDAPEQATGSVNPSTDIYQVGLIIKELSHLTGKERKWRRFIEKATAFHPDNRFQNAEEALKALPSSLKPKKWISILLSVFITGGIISIIIGKKDSREPEFKNPTEAEISIQPENEISDGKDNSTEINATPAVSIDKSSRRGTERNLTDKINRKLDELYSKRVTPMYERMMTDEGYRYRQDVSDEFVDAYCKEYENLITYGEVLKKDYPDYSDFIDERIRISFETKTVRMREALYPIRDARDFKKPEIVVYGSAITE